VAYPKLVRVRQEFDRTSLPDVPAAVRNALERLDLGRTIRPGQSVALTAGSRGIANIAVVLKTTVAFLRGLGAEPFLVPAMGSHGGATAAGQQKVLESYGITEEFVGAPIRASMHVVELGVTAEGYPAVLDRFAREADHIGVVARVKPHTSFHGPIESGLLKMLLIGLGKRAGAETYHRILLERPFDGVVRSVTRVIRAEAPVRFGLALVENAYDETALVEGVYPEEFEPREEELLVRAKAWLAKLPFAEADVLVVDEIGKDISGSGMDTNVVGRKRAFRGQPEMDGQPVMRRIFVRGLSEKAHGNATGIGLADFTTTRLVRGMDYKATVVNCLTAGYPEAATLPVHFDSDREVLDVALGLLGSRRPDDARVLRIRNTLRLDEVDVSEPCLDAARQTEFSPVAAARAVVFGDDGNLPPW
jgi:hypothetical protein